MDIVKQICDSLIAIFDSKSAYTSDFTKNDSLTLINLQMAVHQPLHSYGLCLLFDIMI